MFLSPLIEKYVTKNIITFISSIGEPLLGVKRVRTVRVHLACAIVVAIFLVAAVQQAAAFDELGIPFITSCGFMYMEPFSNTGIQITEFNQASLVDHDFETTNISFPITADGIVAGPTAGPFAADGVSLGSGATSNILPFGPVNLAFPSIDQTVFQSEAYQRTYFFVDAISG
jgi:hypothetical protein